MKILKGLLIYPVFMVVQIIFYVGVISFISWENPMIAINTIAPILYSGISLRFSILMTVVFTVAYVVTINILNENK